MTMTNMMDGKCQSLQLLLGSAPNGTWATAGIMAETLHLNGLFCPSQAQRQACKHTVTTCKARTS